MNSLDFVVNLAKHAASHIEQYTKSGHNGPYHHPETSLRNKGHWLFTFAKVYQWTGDQTFKKAAEPLAEYLLTKDARPHGYSFYHRNVKGKDKSNGLVGQAWTMESLVEASFLFNDNRFVDLAKEVFHQHHFLQDYGIWNKLEIDGKHKAIDYAFNHQLWFAASASLLAQEAQAVKEKVDIFLNKILDNLTVVDNGLIYHELEHEYNDPFQYKPGFKHKLKKELLSLIKTKKSENKEEKYGSLKEKKEVLWEEMKHKSIGYHAFNTYAFAILKANMPEHPFWKTPSFLSIASYLNTDEYQHGIEDNIYSYAYNPPGFEVPFSLLMLENLEEQKVIELSQIYWDRQLMLTYSPENYLFDKSTEDPITLTARIYEISRMPVGLLKKIECNIY